MRLYIYKKQNQKPKTKNQKPKTKDHGRVTASFSALVACVVESESASRLWRSVMSVRLVSSRCGLLVGSHKPDRRPLLGFLRCSFPSQ